MRKGIGPPRLTRSIAIGLLALQLCPGFAVAADLYGLVIGVNDYVGTANDLEGAVNDAQDIAKALQRAGAREVVTLLDAEATKDRVVSEWGRLVATAKAGDTLVLSFAGHGSQEPEPPGRHDEADGLNENFLLGGFESQGEATRERILDDEIFAWMQAADAKEVKAIFIADSCHSGGMQRSASAPGVRFRKVEPPEIVDDRLELPPPEVARLSEAHFEHVTFVAATSEDRLTPEITLGGEKRGALSWAFARALEGRADKDGDGAISEFELLGFLVPVVQALVESQQTPQVLPLRARSVALLTLSESEKAPAPETGSGEDLNLKLAMESAESGEIADLPFVTVVADETKADLIWNGETGKVEHIVGGVVAEGVDAQSIKPVLTKWAALKWLSRQAALSPVSAKLVSGNHRYPKGHVVEVEITGATHPHLTLFNLPPDGRVEFFVPDPRRPEEAAKNWSLEPIREQFRVDEPPYGAEHLIAIFSKKPLPDLQAALSSMSRAEKAAALRTALEQALSGQTFQIGIVDIYTGSGG